MARDEASIDVHGRGVMAGESAPFSRQIGEWIATLDYATLPAPVVAVAKDCVRDFVGCALLGTRARTRPFDALIPDPAPLGPSSIIGSSVRSTTSVAALLNGIHAHSCEVDDGFGGNAGGHPGVVVIPAALAVAEALGASGQDLLVAVVAGYEVMHRATAAIYPETQLRGFQSTGVGGPFGSAAAVAFLLRLHPSETAHALGIAGCSSTGLMEYDQSGGEAKRLYAGASARAGIEAAGLARAGISGPALIFEGKRGVWAGFAQHAEPDRSTRCLGDEFRILEHSYKLYPAVGNIHGAIDALRALHREIAGPEVVRSIEVRVSPATVLHGGAIGVPWDFVSSQYSVAFSLALELHYGRQDIELYESDEVRTHPSIVDMCRRVSVAELPGDHDPVPSAVVTVTLVDGRRLSATQFGRSGDADHPLSDAELATRFRGFAATVLWTDDQVECLFASLGRLDELDDVNELSTHWLVA